MPNRFVKNILMTAPDSRAAIKQARVTEKYVLNRARKQALIHFTSKEERYWDLRYDPNRRHDRGYYSMD